MNDCRVLLLTDMVDHIFIQYNKKQGGLFINCMLIVVERSGLASF